MGTESGEKVIILIVLLLEEIMLNSRLRLFRFIGIVEGVSLLLLLFIAMPMKYILDIPAAVTIAGTIHGFLFLVYCIAIILAVFFIKWPIRYTFGAFLVAFVPFGNFWLESRLKRLKMD